MIVAFAFSVLLNIIFMMNFNSRKEQLLYSLCGDLQNISQVLDNIKVELESTEDSVCSDYNRYALKVCCEKFDIRMEELCNGLSPIYDYARPVSFSRLYNIEFTEAIKEKDIYTIAFYITAINELIEELSNQEENNSLLYNDVTKSMNYSLMLRKIIDKFEFFDEQIRIGSKDLRND